MRKTGYFNSKPGLVLLVVSDPSKLSLFLHGFAAATVST